MHQDGVKIINFVKSHAFNRLFSNLCKDTDYHYKKFIITCRSKMDIKRTKLRRLLLLEDEIKISLTKQNCDVAAFFQNDQWLSKLCYLSDIFEKLKGLNLSL